MFNIDFKLLKDIISICHIEKSIDNKNVLKASINNRNFYIGSKYCVKRDIDDFINKVGIITTDTLIIVFGVGAAEHILELIKMLNTNNKLIIIEPSLTVLKCFHDSENARKIIRDERIELILFDENIDRNLKKYINVNNLNNVKIIGFVNYSNIFKDEFMYLKMTARQIIQNKRIQRDTLTFFSKTLFKNFILNIRNSRNVISINSLKDFFTNKPAIIVSAGPSLGKNIHLLKEVQDNFIIICGARTLKSLFEFGIRADFVCAVDPQEVTYTIMKENLKNNVPLVFMDSTNHELIKNYEGPKILFANQGMEPYLKEITGLPVDSLLQGGSVAHVCMGLAVYMGCRDIIFIGQDLAYTNDKFHADIAKAMQNPADVAVAYFEYNKDKWISNQNENIYVDDIYGSKVRTSVLLNSYREEFEDLIQESPDITFTNSTEGGANINGTIVMDLKDSILSYNKNVLSKDLSHIFTSANYLDKTEINRNLLNIKDSLNTVIKSCTHGITYADQMYYYYTVNKKVDLDKVFSELDKVDVVIGDMQRIGILAYLLSPYMDEILTNEEFIEKPNEIEKESGIRIASRCKALYKNIIKASCEALEYL